MKRLKRMKIYLVAIILVFTFASTDFHAFAQPDKTTITVNSLNVRSGPGLSYDVIGSLKRGDEVEVIITSDDWLQIKYNGHKGWIASWLTSSSGTQNTQPQNREIISQTDALNFRESPSVNAPILNRMNAGDKATMIGREGEWIHVQFQGANGWVYEQYVTEITAANTKPNNKPQTAEQFETFTVAVDTLNVRKKADLTSKRISTIHKGETYTVKQIDGNWVQIGLKNKKDGWVYSFYGEFSTEKESSRTSDATKDQQVTILSNGTNIREDATTSSRIVKRANAGEKFTIKNHLGDWYEISLSNGSTAFIAKWVVAVEDEKTIAASSKKAPREPGTLKGLTIIVDAGHGGNDRGTTGARGTLEKNVTLKTAELLAAKLQAAGAKVHMTRDSDRYISLQKRVSLSHEYNPDAFISIHYDANIDSAITGFTTYYYYQNQAALAKSINNSLNSAISLKSRGAQPGNYYVLRENMQSAVLVELGFLTNPAEELAVNSSSFREQASYGIYKGILNYFDSNIN